MVFEPQDWTEKARACLEVNVWKRMTVAAAGRDASVNSVDAEHRDSSEGIVDIPYS